MNMKKVRKVILTILFILVLFSSNYTFADETTSLDFTKADSFLELGRKKQAIAEGDLNTIGSEFSSIGKVLIYIGAGILVGGMGYIGIMYMTSPPERQGKLKQQLIGLVVSGVVIFGAYAIWSVLINILSGTIG